MDAPGVPDDEMRRTLLELARINALLGGYGASLDAIASLVPPGTTRLRVLDVGCGGGETSVHIADWARRRGIEAEVHGIDLLDTAVSVASRMKRPGLSFSRRDLHDIEENESYDVVHASLMLHHCPGVEAVRALKKMRALSRRGVAINDLHRHPFAYHSIKALTAALSDNRLIRHDAPLSVLRAFRQEELRALFHQAGFASVEVRWRWAFRWSATAAR
jgi:2-polyprenyl-3-methyl-5-hydroxy-6-metoxy-1,4-benzoquinol methylase